MEKNVTGKHIARSASIVSSDSKKNKKKKEGEESGP